ncbi:MAG: hypothetical protein PVH61_41550 [Candidatus Aminicenantes bacterium]|jgi:hypothetical protein
MFRPVLSFESKRFFIKKNFKIFLALFLLLVGLSYDGIRDYKATIDSIESFQETERQKASKFMNYTLYGTRGIRLLFVPGPFCVIFNDLAVYRGLIASVDSGEGLYIFSDLNGKELFSDSSGFLDFSGIIYLIGCLIAILYGYDVTRNQDYLNLLKEISNNNRIVLSIVLSRIILLNLYLILLCFLSLLWFLINGINLFDVSFLYFILVLVLVISSFIAGGAVIGSIKNKGLKIGSLFIVPFVFLLLIPGVIKKVFYNEATNIKTIQKFEFEKLKVMMKFEKRAYDQIKIWKSGKVAPDEIKSLVQSGQEIEYKELKGFEIYRIDMISRRVKAYHLVSSFFPTSFYNVTNRELSSKGFKNFIKFYQFTFNKKYDFIAFYIDRKFYKPFPKTGLEPFIKGDEDLFHSESQLPYFFWMGVFLTFLYFAVLLITLYRMQTKWIKEEKAKSVIVDFNKGNPLFALCKNEKIKSDIFRYYQEQKTAACIDKITVDFHFNGVRADGVLKFLCQLAEAKEEKAIEYLSILGIEDLNTLKLGYEEILKFYAAVKIAQNGVEFIVLNDFFKQETREFEEDFFKMLSALVDTSAQKILYLSCNMYYPKKPLDESFKIDTFYLLPLPIDEVTLR